MLYGRVVARLVRCWASRSQRECERVCMCVCLIFRQALEVKNCGCVCAVAGPLFYFHGSPFSFLMFTLFSNKINCLCAHITSERVVPRTSRSARLRAFNFPQIYIWKLHALCGPNRILRAMPWPEYLEMSWSYLARPVNRAGFYSRELGIFGLMEKWGNCTLGSR